MYKFYKLLHNCCKILTKEPHFFHGRSFLLASQFSNLTELNVHRKLLFLRSIQSDSLKCWNCNVTRQATTHLLCSNCNVLQHPHNETNFFKVLDIGESYAVDTKQLSAKYKQLQIILHPDKYGNRSEKEKNISVEYSSLVNKAYNTLLLPLSRAIHMLHLNGEQIHEDQKATDPLLLMEMMELNEEVEEANTPDKLRELDRKNKAALKVIESEILLHFNKGHMEKAKNAVIKMKYFNSVRLRIHNLMREQGIVD